MLKTTTIPEDWTLVPIRLLSALSFMSEILGDYTTYSDGMITWWGEQSDCWFASLCWDKDTLYVEIADGVEPQAHVKIGHNAIYTIFGYCRYHGISHKLLGATLPVFKELKDEAA